MPHAPIIIETIISLAKAGLSRSAIAERMKLTRSAVCGILHHRGIKSPTKTKASPRPRGDFTPAGKVRRTITKAKVSKPPPPPVICNNLLQTNLPGVTLDELQPHHCRWILDGGLYCGAAKRERSYCDQHAALAYRSPAERQRQAA